MLHLRTVALHRLGVCTSRGSPGFDSHRDHNFLHFFSCILHAQIFVALTLCFVENELIHFFFCKCKKKKYHSKKLKKLSLNFGQNVFVFILTQRFVVAFLLKIRRYDDIPIRHDFVVPDPVGSEIKPAYYVFGVSHTTRGDELLSVAPTRDQK